MPSGSALFEYFPIIHSVSCSACVLTVIGDLQIFQNNNSYNNNNNIVVVITEIKTQTVVEFISISNII